MESKAKLLGHPIHQMVIVLPLGLLATSTVFDLMYAAGKNRQWSNSSFHMLSAGVLSGMGAAVPGLMDYLAIRPGTRAKRIGLLHGVGNFIVTGLFAASWLARRRKPQRPNADAIALSVAGTCLALVTGWLGGELVDRLGIGVHDDAHEDAPSSLRDARSGPELAA
jgi:uncharacterized membrane protein